MISIWSFVSNFSPWGQVNDALSPAVPTQNPPPSYDPMLNAVLPIRKSKNTRQVNERYAVPPEEGDDPSGRRCGSKVSFSRASIPKGWENAYRRLLELPHHGAKEPTIKLSDEQADRLYREIENNAVAQMEAMRKGEHLVTGMSVRELRDDDLRTKDEKNAIHRARHGAENVDSFSIDGTDGKRTWVVTQGGTDAMYVNTALARNKRGEWQFDPKHLNGVFLPMDIHGTDNQGKPVKEELFFLMFYNRPQPFHQGKETQGIAFYGEGSLRLFNRPRDPIAPHERHKISEKTFDQWLLKLRDVGCVSVDIQNKSYDLESSQERKRLWNRYKESGSTEKDTLIDTIQKEFEAFKNIDEPKRPPKGASKKAFHAWFRAMAYTAYDRLTVADTEYDLHLPAHRKALLELPNRHSAFAQIDRDFQERCDRIPDGIFSWRKKRAGKDSHGAPSEENRRKKKASPTRIAGATEHMAPSPNTRGR